ncbi:hypothetical protein PHMEG_00021578 [Phytophthora megakarya]|uniref:Uncharacterized protein n=1 Tax=Phytophthora megakarya TaxID=4795 RepID=A0A225VM67_9STRA|nr:hypothetical protein PHMEG_00021578 [Phytophthora megakarya]
MATKHTTLVRFHFDNTSAVAWASKRSIRHPTVQCYNRMFSLTEFSYKFVFSAEHIAGELNEMADAGSQAWTENPPSWESWANLSSSWSHVEVRPPFDNLSGVWVLLSLPRTTTSKYLTQWLQWAESSQFLNRTPWLKRANRSSSNKLAYFAIYLWRYGWNASGTGNQYPTIQKKLPSVFWYHRRYCYVELSRSPILKVLLQGVKRSSDPIKKTFPGTPAFLRVLLRSLGLDLPRLRLLWGSVLIGYLFLAPAPRRHFYGLKTKDTFFANGQDNYVSEDVAILVCVVLMISMDGEHGGRCIGPVTDYSSPCWR